MDRAKLLVADDDDVTLTMLDAALSAHHDVVANLVWMLWAAGLIMLMAESRLCNAYLFGDQMLTGKLCLMWGAVVMWLASSLILGRSITPSGVWRWLLNSPSEASSADKR